MLPYSGPSKGRPPGSSRPRNHVDPPQSRQVSGYLGGGGLDVTVITVWASLEARDDPAAAGLALANDLAALRDAIRDADLGDVNLRPTFETAIAARADDGVTVAGRLRFEVEVEG